MELTRRSLVGYGITYYTGYPTLHTVSNLPRSGGDICDVVHYQTARRTETYDQAWAGVLLDILVLVEKRTSESRRYLDMSFWIRSEI